MISVSELQAVIETQKEMLQRFEKTIEEFVLCCVFMRLTFGSLGISGSRQWRKNEKVD